MSHTEKTKTAEKTNTTEAVGNFLVELDGKLSGGGGGSAPVAARAEVPPVIRRGESVTPAGLQAAFAAIKEQVASAKAENDGTDFARIDGWVTAAEQGLGQLDPQSSATPQEVEAAMGPRNSNFTAEQAARYDVGGQFLAVIRTLNNIRGKLNAPLQQQRELAEQRALEKQFEEEQRSRSAQKKGASSPKSTKSAKGSEPEDEDEDETDFPHKGKHRAPTKLPNGVLVVGTKGITALTAGKGKEALYFDRDGPTVRQIEADARANGLWVMNHSTLVHRFAAQIGADQGEATRCIRIDGDHGHPIVETGKKNASFDSYVDREVAELVELYKTDPAAALPALRVIGDYLSGIGARLAAYLPKKLPPGLDADLKG